MNVLPGNARRQACGLLLLPLLLSLACLADEPKATAATQKEAVKNVGVEEFEKLRKEKNTIVLDVRTPAEYAKGHLPGAVNIDWNSRDFGEKIAALDKGQKYLVHCAAGVRSAKACDRMAKLQFTNLYNLEGGFKAWEQAGKPVEKAKQNAGKAQNAE